MARRGAKLVVIALLLSVFSCYQVDLPKTLYIEESWTVEEVEQIRRAIDEWNRFSREYCGEDIIIYGGYLADPDGFQSKIDPGDGYNILYKIAKPDENFGFLVETLDHDLGGYATKTDILVFTFKDWVNSALSVIVMHELGHWVGLAHIKDDPNALMSRTASGGHADTITKKGKQAFCIVNGCCVKEP